jgi:sec-independent protein translocase protein TatA
MELFTPGHLLVLAIVVAVLFFGWKQLPDMARSVGRSLRIFKTEIKGMSEDDKQREAQRELDGEAGRAKPAIAPASEEASATPPAAPPVTPPTVSSDAPAQTPVTTPPNGTKPADGN